MPSDRFSLTRNFRSSPADRGAIDALEKSDLFDTGYYTRRYADVAATGLPAIEHYLRIGAALLRDPSAEFSTELYLRRNRDVARAAYNPLLHFLRYGGKDGRKAFPARTILAPDGLPGGELGPTGLFERFRRGAFRRSIADAAAAAATGFTTIDAGMAARANEVIESARARGVEPAISVVMPTWNRREVVGAAIESVFAQAYPVHELVVCDDGSEDGTPAFIREHFAEHVRSGRITIIENEHVGVSAARNAALAAVSGDLVCYLDSDNQWRPEFTLVMAAVFAESPETLTAYSGLLHNDHDRGTSSPFGQAYDRATMLQSNFIDLNVFAHRRFVYDQLGGFDESLKRLVDWDLIARFTRLYEPAYVPFIGADYHLSASRLGNITFTEKLDEPRLAIHCRFGAERLRYDVEEVRLAFVVYDWPALSQTFIMNELRYLLSCGVDVRVYYQVDAERPADLDFQVPATRVVDADDLAERMAADRRNVCHNHFVYPGTTLLAWPACRRNGIAFTCFAHAIDIFHEANRERNRIAEIARDPLCRRIFVYGEHHRAFLVGRGVPQDKIGYSMQAVDLDDLLVIPPHLPSVAPSQEPLRGLFVGRFVEKKGLDVLVRAAAELGDTARFDVRGYGPTGEAARELADELGVRTVEFGSTLDSRAAYLEALRACDFLVVPSRVAVNGDREGFPTVILEALAAGRPVIASRTSSVPDILTDGVNALLVDENDSAQLAAAVARLHGDPDLATALGARGRELARQIAGTERTIRNYVDAWMQTPLNVVLVTYNTPDYDDRAETEEIVSRIAACTSSAYTLTIVDNGSDDTFQAWLREVALGNPNVRLLLLGENLLCGPASNLGIAAGDARHAVYVCSKEGFVARHGWERDLIDYMRAHPGTVMAGTTCHLPRHTLGGELAEHPLFGDFRCPDFARDNPERPFKHVQGGVYILDREAFAEVGGFSDTVPQNGTDVEFSYVLEASGKTIGDCPSVAALTTKTLPRLTAIVGEGTAIAHPLSLDNVAEVLDLARADGAHRCNLCGTNGRHVFADDDACGACGSTPFERSVYRELATNWRCHKGFGAIVPPECASLGKALWQRMFKPVGVERGVEPGVEIVRWLTDEAIERSAVRDAPHGLLIGAVRAGQQPGRAAPRSARFSRGTFCPSRLLRSGVDDVWMVQF